MDDRKLNQLADDVRLISGPVRIASDWLTILVLIAIVPVVFVASFVNWLLTGTPIMSADEILLSKVLLTVLSPFVTTIFYVLHKHLRRRKDPEYQHLIPAPVVFIIVLLFMLVFVKCNFMFGWGFYR